MPHDPFAGSNRAKPDGGIGAFLAPDGYLLHYRHFSTPPQSRRAAVACLHGIQSHSGWYTRSSRQLAEDGFEVFYLDRRGSGLNRDDRGDAQSTSQLIADVVRFIEIIRTKADDVPIILEGVSWGGKIALATAGQHPDLVDALVFICPGWFAQVSPTFREKLGIGWSSVLWPKRLFPVPLSDPALFTESPEAQAFIRQDPLSLRHATARLLMCSRKLDKLILEAAPKIRVPAILMLAGRDKIIDNEETLRFFDYFATDDRWVLQYPIASHTLEFESDMEQIHRDLVGALKEALDLPMGPRSSLGPDQ